MKNRKKELAKHVLLIPILKERYGLVLSYIGGLILYFSTDFTAASSTIHYQTGKMAHNMVVLHEKWLVIGIFMIAIGFIVDFTKKLALENKLLVALIALLPLWQLIPRLLGK